MGQMAAVECERILYEGATPDRANAALLQKAQILVGAGRFEDATQALDRIRMYALSPEQARQAQYYKVLSLYRQQSYEAALAALEEGPLPDGKENLALLVRAANGECKGKKNELTATLLSVIPPLGQIYTGSWKDLWITPVTYGAVCLSVWQGVQHNWITALASAVLLLEPTYVNGSFRNAAARADAANRAYTERKLREMEAELLL